MYHFFDKQINTMRPQLQDQIHSVQSGQKKIKSINNAVSFASDRVQILESKLKETQDALNAALVDIRILKQGKVAEEIKLKTGILFLIET